VVETIRLSVTGPALSSDTSDALAQTGNGDIGGMFVAVVLLVGLGLAAVTLWHGALSTVTGRLRGSTDDESTDQTRGLAAESASTPAEPEPDTDRQLESQESTDTEPLDQDVVLGILNENGGRMKQARIVDATDWSKSKVSMVLSEMEENGDITKLRVGRENLISLEGSEPEAAESPFDDE
jgi:uncharacterized membrane protein